MMINLQNIESGLEFGRKAESALIASKEDKGWQILAEGYRKNLEDLLSEAKQYQPNTDLTRDRLFKLCNKYDWFCCGSVKQYDKLFEMLRDGATTHDLAVMIYICSDMTEWTIESIQKILDQKMYCAVLHGEVYLVSDYESIERFLTHEASDNPDWEICEFSARQGA